MRIVCSTTFDITATEVRSNFQAHRIPFRDATGRVINDLTTWQRARNQQRNWETMNQIISLRVLPQNISLPVLSCRDGIKYWTFDFEIDQSAALEIDGDPVGELKRDSYGVPMIAGLDESTLEQSTLVPDINVFFVARADK